MKLAGIFCVTLAFVFAMALIMRQFGVEWDDDYILSVAIAATIIGRIFALVQRWMPKRGKKA